MAVELANRLSTIEEPYSFNEVVYWKNDDNSEEPRLRIRPEACIYLMETLAKGKSVYVDISAPEEIATDRDIFTFRVYLEKGIRNINTNWKTKIERDPIHRDFMGISINDLAFATNSGSTLRKVFSDAWNSFGKK